MREQMALYAWRRSFFLSQFADGGWTTDCNFLCMADGVCGEVVHSQAAIHYNITENCENLLSMVISGQTNPYILKAKKLADSAFKSKIIGGKRA